MKEKDDYTGRFCQTGEYKDHNIFEFIANKLTAPVVQKKISERSMSDEKFQTQGERNKLSRNKS
jgi:hypothetical protein